jgi:hypothetical protein
MTRPTHCVPGDLAIFVAASRERFAGNIGRIVQVVGPASDYFVELAGGMPCWHVRTLGGVVVTREGVDSVGVARDCDLRPIRGQRETVVEVDKAVA